MDFALRSLRTLYLNLLTNCGESPASLSEFSPRFCIGNDLMGAFLLCGFTTFHADAVDAFFFLRLFRFLPHSFSTFSALLRIFILAEQCLDACSST